MILFSARILPVILSSSELSKISRTRVEWKVAVMISSRHITPLEKNRVYKICFKSDHGSVTSMRASDWHPFFVFDGKKIKQIRADELKKGMAVIGSSSSFDGKLDYDGWFQGYITK